MPTTPFTVSLGACFASSKLHKRNLFMLIVDALAESNWRRAEREIAALLARHDRQFSDRASS
jgi:hypothetical protein